MMCIYQYPVTPSPASDSTTVIQRKGTIQPIRMEKEPYEAVVSAEGSRFHLLFGSQYSGNFLCIPDWHIGCELSYLNDVFWNQESIAESNHDFREEDVAAIAYAVKRLKSMVK